MRILLLQSLFLALMTSACADWQIGDDFEDGNPLVSLESYIGDPNYSNYFWDHPLDIGVQDPNLPSSIVCYVPDCNFISSHCSTTIGETFPHLHALHDVNELGDIDEINERWEVYYESYMSCYAFIDYNIIQSTITRDPNSNATVKLDCATYAFHKVFSSANFDYIPWVDSETLLNRILLVEAYETHPDREYSKPNDIIAYVSRVDSPNDFIHFAIVKSVDSNTGKPSEIEFKYDWSPVFSHETDPNYPFYSPEGDSTLFRVFRKKPSCWFFPRQCHGDADGNSQGNRVVGYSYVSVNDLAILVNAWQIKEPPKGIGLTEEQMCADFDHQLQGNSADGYYRVGTADLDILTNYWQIKEPPKGQGVPADCLD